MKAEELHLKRPRPLTVLMKPPLSPSLSSFSLTLPLTRPSPFHPPLSLSPTSFASHPFSCALPLHQDCRKFLEGKGQGSFLHLAIDNGRSGFTIDDIKNARLTNVLDEVLANPTNLWDVTRYNSGKKVGHGRRSLSAQDAVVRRFDVARRSLVPLFSCAPTNHARRTPL